MLARPIPAFLMRQSARVMPRVDGAYGGELGEPVQVSCVRIVPAAEARRTDALLDGVRAVMFVDAVNSRGYPTDGLGLLALPIGSVVAYGGEEYAVASVDAMRAESRIHHWEVSLS